MAASSSILDLIRDHPARAAGRWMAEVVRRRPGESPVRVKGGDPSTLFFPVPGVHILTIERQWAGLPFARITRGDRTPTVHEFVPTLARTAYLVETHLHEVMLHADVPGLQTIACRSGQIADLTRVLRQHWEKTRLGLTLGAGVFILPLLGGAGDDARALLRSLRRLDRLGFGVGNRNLRETLRGERECRDEAETVVAGGAGETRIGFHLHLHYPELWPDFAARLRQLMRSFRLIVTLTQDNRELHDRITDDFPGASVFIYENRGRDVGPFLQLWRDGQFSGLDLVCKMHGKRTGISGPTALLGEIWRRAMIQDLIGSNATVDANIAIFRDPAVGMVGSERVRFPNAYVNEQSAWGMNKDATLSLARRIGVVPQRCRLDFFGGTMFWIRPELLELLKPLNLSLADFPEESGQADATLQHALERLFGALPAAAGMRMEVAGRECVNGHANLGLTDI